MRDFFTLLLFECLFFPATAQTEQYAFSRIDAYNGLSNNQVNAVFKDDKGFVWFGTMSGLNRYDGYSFKVFRNNSKDSTTIQDNSIPNLFPLPDGKIWVAGYSPSIYCPNTEKFDRNYTKYLRGLSMPQENIVRITRDSHNNYWFIFDTLGIYQYSPHTGKTIAIQHRENDKASVATNQIATIKEDSKGNMWIVHRNGIIEKLDAASKKVTYRSESLNKVNRTNYFYSCFIDTDDEIWIWTGGVPNAVFLFHPDRGTTQILSDHTGSSRLSSNIVKGITQDSQGIIWIATDHGGINLIDKRHNFDVHYLSADPKNSRTLSQNSINTLYKDKSGVIWIGTFKQGVNYLDENLVHFPYYRHSYVNASGLPFDDVNRFAEDKDGNVWIGTNGGGLIYFNRKQNTFKQFVHDPSDPHSLSNNVIVSLCIDQKDQLWIGSYFGGLSRFDGKGFINYKHNPNNPESLADDCVWEIFQDDKHNMWIGTLSGGLEMFDPETGTFIHHQSKQDGSGPIQANYISSLMQDRKGNLWIGTSHGVDVFDKTNTKPVHYTLNNNNNIISLLQASNGLIWIGTREGLMVFDETTGVFRTFTTAQGLPDNTILTILEDNQHHLWITTPSGLFNLVPRDGKDINALDFLVINYDETNNLQSREFNENAALKLHTGELMVGGPGGFNIIDPSNIVRYRSKPAIVFTNLQILNNNIEPGEEINHRVLLHEALPNARLIHLKYKENVFSVEFAALDFSHGIRDKYAYKLEGFNNDWLYTDGSSRKATYTNLDPGSYTLKVKMLDANNEWTAEKQLTIIIDPPFWRTAWAYLIYIFIVTVIVYTIRKITMQRRKMKYEVEKQRHEAERIQALDTMKTKFFTNVSHEFRTPLSLILSPLDTIIRTTADADKKKQLHMVQRNAQRLLKLVNQMLDFRKMEVQEFKLYPVAGDVVRFIKEISYSFSDLSDKKHIEFAFASNVESLEIYFDKDKLEKIMFNLLSNAFKYTYDDGKVSVNLFYNNTREDHTLLIQVCDTGIGIAAEKHDRIFDRFFQDEVPVTMVNQGSGLGLAIAKEFVRLHNGTISVNSEPGKGACFSVALPVWKIHDSHGPDTHEQMPAVEDINEHQEEVNKETRGGKKKKILVVEDNDDFRTYLKDNLKLYYEVEEAVNGKVAWEKLIALNPDLVVSDIMMPEVNGIELARRIRNGVNTAHIPVILLTAMGDEETQMKGYQAGINDYIAKPFTFHLLDLRIRNLLSQQKLLQRKFQKQVEVNPSEVTVTPLDEQFIKQALAIVEKNIGNFDFSVEELSKGMYMSRVALYTKILSLTGKGPLEFIRAIRLKRGAQLLRKSQLNISEIAYEVGFRNPKIFTRYFKEEFNILPSQYQADNEIDKDTISL